MDARILPVLNKAVQIFKEPPERGTDWKKQQKKTRGDPASCNALFFGILGR